jgi:hypothetical protein
MRERKHQLTTASAISAWPAASSPSLRSRGNTLAVSCSEYRRQVGEQKANMIGWTCTPGLSDVHDQLYGSVRSLKRVRCIEAAVA